MFFRILFLFFVFVNLISNVKANEKQLIIDELKKINNLSFNFEQIIKSEIEIGSCLLVFNNKLKCYYKSKLKKEIIINNKTLVIWQKRYNKKYFYPVSKSPFINILNKKNLIELIEKSDLALKQNIELMYLDKNKKITIFFEKNSYELIGWLIEDEFQNEIFFSIKIKKTNTQIEEKEFKIPSISKESN